MQHNKHINPILLSRELVPANDTKSVSPYQASTQLVPSNQANQSGLILSETSSVNFVQQWLRRKSFHNFQSKEPINLHDCTSYCMNHTVWYILYNLYILHRIKFANFSGQDMLILQREDFIQIGQEGPGYMSIAECIRLFNAVRR